MILVIGVDPGLHGALAAIRLYENGPRIIDVIDTPVIGSGTKARIDAIATQEWLLRHNPYRAFVEIAQSMPKQGISSAFRYGRATGAIESIITVCGIPVEYVAPALWKRALRLRGQDKEASRQYALQLFPHAHHLLKRKLDHNRSEAALLAYFGIHFQMLARPEPAPVAPVITDAAAAGSES
jgi:hypothetical protein